MLRVSEKVKKARPEPDAPLEITIYDRPSELRMSLPPDSILNRQVKVRMDGIVMSTLYPDSDGTVHLVPYMDDMNGERNISIHDETGNQISGRTLVFRHAV